MQSFILSSWLGEAPCGTHEFDAPNVDHAIGYCRGLMSARLEQMGAAYIALGGCYERLDCVPEKDARRLNETTHVGTWHYVQKDDEVGMVWAEGREA